MGKMINKIDNIKKYLKKHERYAFPVFLLLGFIVDTFTLNRVDQWFDNIILSSYLILAGMSLIFIYGEPPIKKHRIAKRFDAFVPFVFLYAIGGLFSGLVILYSKSGSLIVSFPFMIILLSLFIGNEFLYKKYPRLVFQSLVFYVAVFSYSILITPILIRSVGYVAFILGALLSIAIMYGFLTLLEHYTGSGFKIYQQKLHFGVSVILAGFSILYFTNIIPPIPLSLKDVSVHHSIYKNDNGSYIVGSDTTLLKDKRPIRETIYKKPGESVYVFSSVFVPTKIATKISHEWSYFDDNKNRWISTNKIPISIIGGRDTGYRGYSYKSNVFNGLWKVEVRASDGKLIGNQRFLIKDWNKEIERFTEIK